MSESNTSNNIFNHPSSSPPNNDEEIGESNKSEVKQKMSPTKKKLLRMLTVMVYLSAITSGAFILSLYYLFLWTPKRGLA